MVLKARGLGAVTAPRPSTRRIAARARELVDQGTPIEAACRIIILEDQLEEAQRINEQLRAQDREQPTTSAWEGRHRPPTGQ